MPISPEARMRRKCECFGYLYGMTPLSRATEQQLRDYINGITHVSPLTGIDYSFEETSNVQP